jgi:hypothetical protein
VTAATVTETPLAETEAPPRRKPATRRKVTAKAPPETAAVPAEAAEEEAAPAARTAEVIIAEVKAVIAAHTAQVTRLRRIAVLHITRGPHSMCEGGSQEWLLQCRLPQVTRPEREAGRALPVNEPVFPEIPRWGKPADPAYDFGIYSEEGLEALLAATRDKVEELRGIIRAQCISAGNRTDVPEKVRDEALAAMSMEPPRKIWSASLEMNLTWSAFTADFTEQQRAEIAAQAQAVVHEIMTTRGGSLRGGSAIVTTASAVE